MLKPYDVICNGTKTTLLLSDEDARARGLFLRSEPGPDLTDIVAARDAAKGVKARRPANKNRTPANKTIGD